MSNGTRGETGPTVPAWPPPQAQMARTLSFVTAGGAATAGFLGCCLNLPGACLTAGILALLSLVFNLWDFFQRPGRGAYRAAAVTDDPANTADRTGPPGSSGGPSRY